MAATAQAATGQKLRIDTARVFLPLLSHARYKGAHGGRGSAKSNFFADGVIDRCIEQPGTRVVCIREVQRSLEQSVKRLLDDKLAKYRPAGFRSTESRIITPGNGVIIFNGMQDHTADSIKSLEGFDVAYVEEAQNLSARSLRLLRPTMFRKPRSEIWFSWNPMDPSDPVDSFLRGNSPPAGHEGPWHWEPPPESVVVETNWSQNPWFPDGLKTEKDYDFRVDPEGAAHVWDGGYWLKADHVVLSGKYRIEEFDVPAKDRRHPQNDWDGPYHGADWGFAHDPTTLIRFWIRPDGALMIEREAYRVACDLLDTPDLFESAVPDVRAHMIRADCARPETINHMKRIGFRCEGAEKWNGSVEDGIAWLRGRPLIVIHPRCAHTARQAKLWRYKTDKLTGDVLPALVDGNEDCWDAIRYGAAPMIQRKSSYTVLSHIR